MYKILICIANGRFLKGIRLEVGHRESCNRPELCRKILDAAITHHVGDFAQGQLTGSDQLFDFVDFKMDGKFLKGGMFMFREKA